jgi:hypothetical protein
VAAKPIVSNREAKNFNQASKAYAKDMAATQPHLVRPDGSSDHANAFYLDSKGKTQFNPWVDSANKNLGENDYTISDGKRIETWKAVPEYYQANANEDFDYISEALSAMQHEGNAYLERLYNRQSSDLVELA